MKIVVTGAAGFIGQRLIARWPIEDHILGIDLLPFRPPRDDCSILQLDLRDQLKTEAVISYLKPHLIIHLAAISSRTDPRGDEFIIGYNASLTQSVLRAASLHQTAVVIACSGAEYGDIRPDSARPREDAILRPDDAYAASKVITAMTGIGYAKQYGIPVQVFRFANVYGPGQKPPKIIPNIVDKVLAGNTIMLKGRGEQTRPWIFVDDLIDAVRHFWWHLPSSEICNLVVDEEISMSALTKMVILNLTMKVPGLAGKRFDDFVELSDESGGTQRVTMSGWKMRRLRFMPRYPLEIGLPLTIEHILKEKNIAVPATTNP